MDWTQEQWDAWLSAVLEGSFTGSMEAFAAAMGWTRPGQAATSTAQTTTPDPSAFGTSGSVSAGLPGGAAGHAGFQFGGGASGGSGAGASWTPNPKPATPPTVTAAPPTTPPVVRVTGTDTTVFANPEDAKKKGAATRTEVNGDYEQDYVWMPSSGSFAGGWQKVGQPRLTQAAMDRAAAKAAGADQWVNEGPPQTDADGAVYQLQRNKGDGSTQLRQISLAPAKTATNPFAFTPGRPEYKPDTGVNDQFGTSGSVPGLGATQSKYENQVGEQWVDPDTGKTMATIYDANAKKTIDIVVKAAPQGWKKGLSTYEEAVLKAKEQERLDAIAKADETKATDEARWKTEFDYRKSVDTERAKADKDKYLANLKANPASWLEYSLAANTQPAIQPWMLPLMPQQYAGTVAGAPIPGWDVKAPDMSQLPALTDPSAQFFARMGPVEQKQFYGYNQARTGATPEQTEFKLWSKAPPSGRNPQFSFARS